MDRNALAKAMLDFGQQIQPDPKFAPMYNHYQADLEFVHSLTTEKILALLEKLSDKQIQEAFLHAYEGHLDLVKTTSGYTIRYQTQQHFPSGLEKVPYAPALHGLWKFMAMQLDDEADEDLEES